VDKKEFYYFRHVILDAFSKISSDAFRKEDSPFLHLQLNDFKKPYRYELRFERKSNVKAKGRGGLFTASLLSTLIIVMALQAF
jgi:hypothetical protein